MERLLALLLLHHVTVAQPGAAKALRDAPCLAREVSGRATAWAMQPKTV